MIIITMSTRLNDEHRDNALRVAQKVSAATMAEPGCIDYRFWVSPEDPNSIMLVEKWEDQAALDAHMTSPSLAELGAALGPAIEGGLDAVKHDVSSFGPLFG
jgi:quinol monooxygenase YgiN